MLACSLPPKLLISLWRTTLTKLISKAPPTMESTAALASSPSNRDVQVEEHRELPSAKRDAEEELDVKLAEPVPKAEAATAIIDH